MSARREAREAARLTGAGLTRRGLLAALAGAIVVPRIALAQDPRASQVQNAARAWLALADKLDSSGTWQAAGSRFQQSVPETRWTALLHRERGARGQLVQRTAAATSFTSELPQLPERGNFALIRFRTSFANEPNGSEDVTLEQGPDSVWRVIGYVIH